MKPDFSPRAGRVTGYACAVAALVVICLALPRLASAIAALPGDRAAGVISLGYTVPGQESLGTLIESRRTAFAISSNGRLLADSARARLLLADRAPNSEERWALIHGAVQDLEAALSLVPADAFAWASLSYGRGRLFGQGNHSALALQNSILLAPNEPRLILWRFDAGLEQIGWMDEMSQRLVFGQAERAFAADPDAAVRIARRLNAGPIMRSALYLNAAALAAFEDRWAASGRR